MNVHLSGEGIRSRIRGYPLVWLGLALTLASPIAIAQSAPSGPAARLVVFGPIDGGIFDPQVSLTNVTGRIELAGGGGDGNVWVSATVLESGQTSAQVQTGTAGEFTIPDLPLAPGVNTIQVTAVDAIPAPPVGAGELQPRGTGYPLVVTARTEVHSRTLPQLLQAALADLSALRAGAGAGVALRISAAIAHLDAAVLGLSAQCRADTCNDLAAAIGIAQVIPGGASIASSLDDGLSCLVTGMVRDFGERMGGRLQGAVRDIERLAGLAGSTGTLGTRARFLAEIADIVCAEALLAPRLARVFRDRVHIRGTYFGDLLAAPLIPGAPLSGSGVSAASGGRSRQVFLDRPQNLVRAVDLAAASTISALSVGGGTLLASSAKGNEFALHDPAQSLVRRIDLATGLELAPIDLSRFGPPGGGMTHRVIGLAYSDDGSRLAIALDAGIVVFATLRPAVSQIDVTLPGATLRPSLTWNGSADMVFVVDSDGHVCSVTTGGVILEGHDALGPTHDIFFLSELGVIAIVQELAGGDLRLNVRLAHQLDSVVRNISLDPQVGGASPGGIVKISPRDIAVRSVDGTRVVVFDVERGFPAHRVVNAPASIALSADF